MEDALTYKYFDCVVIGGGAAGLMAAITAARQHRSVAIIEHTPKLGTKLLQTGNGKCNFTNTYMESSCFHENGSRAMQVIHQFNEKQTIHFFESIGIFSKEKNGYIYPHSETSFSLRDALISEIKRLGVYCITSFVIDEIHSSSVGFKINQHIVAKTIIFATGLKAAPKTGSDGSILPFIQEMGQPIIDILPALVPLECSPHFKKICDLMAGVRSFGQVTAYCKGKKIASDTGEIQYTDYGISGIPVFQISHSVVKQLHKGNPIYVVIDMIPDFSEKKLMDYIDRYYDIYSYKTIEDFFGGLIHTKLIKGVAQKCGYKSLKTLGEYKKKDIKQLIMECKQFKMDIEGYKSFDRAQVCQGGVDMSYIDIHTMQSTLVKGVYFAGELVDIDGICGGYNLQWAWSSGYVAGYHAARKDCCEKSITVKSDCVQGKPHPKRLRKSDKKNIKMQ